MSAARQELGRELVVSGHVVGDAEVDRRRSRLLTAAGRAEGRQRPTAQIDRPAGVTLQPSGEAEVVLGGRDAALIAEIGPDGEGLFVETTSVAVTALLPGDRPEVLERGGEPDAVALVLEQVACGREAPDGHVVVALQEGEHAGPLQGLGTHRRRGPVQRRDGLLQPRSGLLVVAAPIPKRPEQRSEVGTDLRPVGQAAAQHGPQVVVLEGEALQPARLVGSLQGAAGLLGQLGEEGRVRREGLRPLAALGELVRRVLAHRLEHPVPVLGATVGHLDQRLVDERGEQVDDMLALDVATDAHGLDREQGEAGLEGGETTEERLFAR